MALAVKTYTQTKKPPVNKRMCYQKNKIRAGARATDNALWCMNPFPPVTYRDNINIGELAPDSTTDDTSRSYMTSRTWTDGKDPTTPQYPFDAVNDNTPELWHYQLVYDKHNMVGMTSVTEDGVTYKKGYPTALWNTELLQFYFLDSTIQEMRQYYCIQALIDVPEGTWDAAATPPGVHPKCWGYLNVSVPGYKYTPMTMPGLPDISAATQAVLATPAPTATVAQAAAGPTALDIAKSIPWPRMITVFDENSYPYFGGYSIGSTLSDASARSLGFDPTKGSVKLLDQSGNFKAIVSPAQTRAAISSSANGWPIIAVNYGDSDWPYTGAVIARTLIGRLNVGTLLAT
jgi:hypothetical protein